MTVSSYEVEVKIAINDPKGIKKKLLELGAVYTKTEIQVDTYFNHPCRNFEFTDEALRLRSRENTSIPSESGSIPATKIELTYKGPKIDKTTKTRFEMSSDIGDAKTIKSILFQLGFKEVAVLSKERLFYSIDNSVASIDLVQHVGTFLEVEQIVTSEEMIPASREKILQFVERLGLTRSDSIRESYLELFLRKELS